MGIHVFGHEHIGKGGQIKPLRPFIGADEIIHIVQLFEPHRGAERRVRVVKPDLAIERLVAVVGIQETDRVLGRSVIVILTVLFGVRRASAAHPPAEIDELRLRFRAKVHAAAGVGIERVVDVRRERLVSVVDFASGRTVVTVLFQAELPHLFGAEHLKDVGVVVKDPRLVGRQTRHGAGA